MDYFHIAGVKCQLKVGDSRQVQLNLDQVQSSFSIGFYYKNSVFLWSQIDQLYKYNTRGAVSMHLMQNK